MRRCNAMRTPVKKPNAAQQPRAYRCRNDATRAIQVFQSDRHSQVADGWFEVELCDSCFFRSNANAIVKVTAGKRTLWRYL